MKKKGKRKVGTLDSDIIPKGKKGFYFDGKDIIKRKDGIHLSKAKGFYIVENNQSYKTFFNYNKAEKEFKKWAGVNSVQAYK